MRTTSTIAAIAIAFAANAASAQDLSSVSTTPLEKLRLEALQVTVATGPHKEKDIRGAGQLTRLDKFDLPCDARGQRENGDNCVLVWKRIDGKPDVLAWVDLREVPAHRLPVLGTDGKLY